MIELDLIGYTADFGHLVLELGNGTGGRYRLVVDADLFATIDDLRDERRQASLPVGDLAEFAEDLGVSPAGLEGFETPRTTGPADHPEPPPTDHDEDDQEEPEDPEPRFRRFGTPAQTAPPPEPDDPLGGSDEPPGWDEDEDQDDGEVWASRARPAPAPASPPTPPAQSSAFRIIPAPPKGSGGGIPGGFDDDEDDIVDEGFVARLLDERRDREAAARPPMADAEPDEPEPDEPEPDEPELDEPEPVELDLVEFDVAEPDPVEATAAQFDPDDEDDAAGWTEATDADEYETPDLASPSRRPPRPLTTEAPGPPPPSRSERRMRSSRPSNRPQPTLSPAEIQARLRSGKSVRSVAKAAGVDEDWIRRWEMPILAERARVLGQAHALRLERARLGRSSHGLGEAVTRNLTGRGVKDEAIEWSVSRRRDGRWRVVVSYVSRGRRKSVTWTYDVAKDTVEAASDNARDLGFTRRRSR